MPNEGGGGTILRINSHGDVKVIYRFRPGRKGNFPSGQQPFARLVEGNDGYFYGTTVLGGTSNSGVIFKVSKQGALQVLHTFCAKTITCPDGASPQSVLTLGSDGNLYGAALQGGLNDKSCPSGCGTLFRITPDGKFTVLHSVSFAKECRGPLGLTQASDGNFYGTTSLGDAVFPKNNCGAVFRLTPSGQFTVLHSFNHDHPSTRLTQARTGKLYGASYYIDEFSAFNYVYEISLSGAYQVIHSLQDNEGFLANDLIQASDGNLWDTSSAGGTNLGQYGAVFALTTGGSFLKTYAFDFKNGWFPGDTAIQAADGKFYGMTEEGDANYGQGVVWTLDAGLAPPQPLIGGFSPSSGKVGSKVLIRGQHFIATKRVSFDRVPAPFQVLNTQFIVATVPQGATTGPITVRNPGGTAKSKSSFTVQ